MSAKERLIAGNTLVRLSSTYKPIEIRKPSATVIDIVESADLAAIDVGLAKYSRSMVPGAYNFQQPHYDQATERWLTGIDEKAYWISEAPDSEAVRQRIKEIREDLELKTGIPDLSATSTYWETVNIPLHEIRYLNLENPNDLLKFYVIVANNWVLPTKEERNNPAYSRAKYAFSYPEEEAKVENETLASKDDLIIRINELKNSGIQVLKHYGVRLYGYREIPKTITIEVLFNRMRKDIESLRSKKDIQRMKDLLTLDADQTVRRNIVDMAIDKNIITFKNQVYEYGSKTLGTSRPQLYENFKNASTGFEETYVSIVAQIKENDK